MRQWSREKLGSSQILLPLEEITRDVVCLKGGSYRAVLQTGSVNFALRSEAEQEVILAGYRRFLNSLSYPLQVLVHVVPSDVDAYLQGLRGHRTRLQGEMLSRLALDHEAFVRRMARERTLLERRFYVVVPSGTGDAVERSAFRWPMPWRRDQHARKQRDFLAASRRLAFRCSEVTQALAAFGLPARRLSEVELASVWRDALGSQTAVSPVLSMGPVVTAVRGKALVADA